MGTAELAGLLKGYRGSYIMAFGAYNAGAGRVQQWVAEHGDPRDPKIDAIDWVERIPLDETRNYVERVMENLQVYRTQFGTTTATFEPNLRDSSIGLLGTESNTFVQSVLAEPSRSKHSIPELPGHARRLRASPADLGAVLVIEPTSPRLLPQKKHRAKPHITKALHKTE